MDYKNSAKQILDAIGGKENLISAAHCATRLRFIIADNAKVKKETLENIDVVKGVFEASGQLQIIIGTGTVNKVFDEVIAIANIAAATTEDLKKQVTGEQNAFKRLIKILGDVFVPIIPAIVAGGLIMGIMEAVNFMVNNGFLDLNTESYIFTVLKLLSNAAFVFLPILIGFSATKVFGGNPYLGAVVAMFLVHPDLQNAWTTAEGFNQSFSIFGLYDVHMVGYQGHVIPIILASFILATIEKKLHKVVPDIIDLFVTPLVSLLTTGFLVYTFIGPVFVSIENGIIDGIQKLLTLPLGIGSLIMGGAYSSTVVAGIHHMYTVIDIGQIAKYGVTFWLPLASAANMAQGAACLAVAMKSKDKKIKSMAFPSALACMLGITEPAIFGVNLRFVKPFVCGSIGGACGAMVASILHLGATATGVTGFFGILLTLHSPLKYIISMGVAVAVAFVLTWFFGIDQKEKKESLKEKADVEKEVLTEAVFDEKATTEKCDDNAIYAPLEGKLIAMKDIPDPTFAAGVLGETIAIDPAKGIVYAPDDAVVSTVFDTKHAIGLELQNGVELLIHVGINTVELNGEGFTTFVEEGQNVTKGQKLLSFDKDLITKKGFSAITPVIVTNADDFSEINMSQKSDVKTMDILINVTKA